MIIPDRVPKSQSFNWKDRTFGEMSESMSTMVEVGARMRKIQVEEEQLKASILSMTN